MESLLNIFVNKAVLVPIMAFLAAQFMKVLLSSLRKKSLSYERFLESGGMPSAHASFITSVAITMGIMDGFDSTTFALAFGIAVIVFYDAVGVRRATGNHAKVINDMKLSEDKLFEKIGHNPLEVSVGALLGAILTIIILGLS